MTPERKAEIHNAMEAAGGSATKAAVLLGIPTTRLYWMIHKNAELKARWAKPRDHQTKPPTEAVTVYRPLPAVAPSAEMEVADALSKADARLRKGLENIGLKDSRLDIALAAQELTRMQFNSCMELINGCIVMEFLNVQHDVSVIRSELKDATLHPAREAILRQDRAQLLEIMGRYFDRTNKGALTQAIIKSKQAEGKGRAGKPGFSPMVIAENVQINTDQRRPPKPNPSNSRELKP